MSAGTVKVIAVEDGFFNGVHRRRDDVFTVAQGQETMSSWFRPVSVGSVPQGVVEGVVLPKPRSEVEDEVVLPKLTAPEYVPVEPLPEEALRPGGPRVEPVEQTAVKSVSTPNPPPVVQPVFELHKPDDGQPIQSVPQVKPAVPAALPKVEAFPSAAQPDSPMFEPARYRAKAEPAAPAAPVVEPKGKLFLPNKGKRVSQESDLG